ncbi:MAG: hypothetical protein Q9191_002294 [Dirinaria sp. TL-2023a]
MPAVHPSTGLTITNPLILYRTLLATKRIDPDPAQHRLAIHLQKIYHRLVDYEPEIEYSHHIRQLSRTVAKTNLSQQPREAHESGPNGGPKGILAAYRARNDRAETLALTRKLTDHESATQIQSPQGLLLYGEVGTGKSMLIDLFADCLPNGKKRRWHFNAFMLETFSRLEQLRKSRLGSATAESEEPSLVLLAKDLISTSPIIFLDEFQLPDRAASKILSNLLTSFFHLGGVLIATSNRMPEELANASGIEFTTPPASRLGLFRSRWGSLGKQKIGRGNGNTLPDKGDFAAFLEVLRSRCEIFQMEGAKDWRRHSAKLENTSEGEALESIGRDQGFEGLEPMAPGNIGLGYEQSVHSKPAGQSPEKERISSKMVLPRNYLLSNTSSSSDNAWELAVLRSFTSLPRTPTSIASIPWQSTSIRVYGRGFIIPKHFSGVTHWDFAELCSANVGPADYISLASKFHTMILTDVPMLTLLQKNEARRFITLLDALYEARCKLLVRAEAGPDDIFFPENLNPVTPNGGCSDARADGVYPETFSEIYQDTVSPFRPNISAYISSASAPSNPSPSHRSARSILADEDSDFGPTYGAGRSRGLSDGAPGAGHEIGSSPSAPNFSRTGSFTGEDERFAYKRARSRLWEMCSEKWWARQEPGWWRPLSEDVRRWERSSDEQEMACGSPLGASQNAELGKDEQGLFRHGASPFRTASEPPPKIGWSHAWGMMKWGKKAGAWGKGAEGLDERKKGTDT